MSACNSQRPESRASTTSGTSQQNEGAFSAHDVKTGQMSYIPHGPEAALMQYHQTNMPPQMVAQFDAVHQPHLGHQHAQTVHFPVSAPYGAQDSPFMQQEIAFAQHARMGSVPAQVVPELHEDKRRKGSAVTATNDKELREMLAKNEGRPLRDVAQEVIQKERTPMAEKTKQLFAMLWWANLLRSL